MNLTAQQDAGLFATRLILAFIFMWHGAEKAFNPELGVEKFVNMGFPGFLGPIIGGLEVIGAILLVIGFQVRWTTIVLAGIIVVAFVGVQLPNGFQAGLERDLLILGASLVLLVFGSGKFALSPDKMPSVEAKASA